MWKPWLCVWRSKGTYRLKQAKWERGGGAAAEEGEEGEVQHREGHDATQSSGDGESELLCQHWVRAFA